MISNRPIYKPNTTYVRIYNRRTAPNVVPCGSRARRGTRSQALGVISSFARARNQTRSKARGLCRTQSHRHVRRSRSRGRRRCVRPGAGPTQQRCVPEVARADLQASGRAVRPTTQAGSGSWIEVRACDHRESRPSRLSPASRLASGKPRPDSGRTGAVTGRAHLKPTRRGDGRNEARR